MTSLTSAVAVSSSGVTPVTDTVSARLPSGSAIGTSSRCPTCSETFDRVTVRKPSRLMVSVYSPTGSAGRKKRPLASEVRATRSPLATCTATTDAPGRTPPTASVTTP